MSDFPSYSITQDMTDGQSAIFRDVSTAYGEGSNPDYGDIRAVRLYKGDYVQSQNPTTLSGSGEMDQYSEYQSSTLAPFTYDLKIVPVAGRFIPFTTGVNVQANSIMTTTGRFANYTNPADYLPTANINALTLYPSDFGLTETVFPDRVYSTQYEIYTDTSPGTLANVTDGNTYIVYGGSTGTCTYNGSVYRTGEVFVAGDNGAVTFANGAVLKILYALTFKFFCLTYNIEKSLAELTIQALSDCKCTDELMYRITVARAKLAGITFANPMNWTSAALAQATIDDLTTEVATINNWYNSQ